MTMRSRRVAGLAAIGAAGLVAALCAAAQTHKVETPQAVVRAIGVYEWTGELKSPKASRLVPVTVFIDGELHDAGVYQPRPIPFALEAGVEYEVQRAGATEGMLVLETARHRAQDDNGEGDAWFGYGRYRAEASQPAAARLRASKNPPVIIGSKDADAKTAGQTGAGKDSAGGSQQDAGRPTMRRRGDADSGAQTAGGGGAGTDDASAAGSGGSGTASASGGRDRETNASDDVDRPTLKRRTPAEDKKERKKGDLASVTAHGGPEVDPDRPVLHRGGATDLGQDTGVPELLGTPPDLQQAAAVSDAATRPEHGYARAWTDDAERLAILGKMQTLARSQLAAYHGVAGAKEMNAAAASVESDPGRPALRRGSPAAVGSTTARAGTGSAGASGRTASQRRGVKAAGPLGVVLAEEQLKGFTLSYGAQPTFVYTARTGGEGVPRYVMVVAQQEISGELHIVLHSVTDAGHLDRTPWMRFVDAVDAEASNRASLLFEQRYASSRSFALYRVLGESATQLAATGSTP